MMVKYLVARDDYQEGDLHVSDFDYAKMSDAYDLVEEGGRVGKRWRKNVRFDHGPGEAIPIGKLTKNAVANSFGWLIVDASYKALLEKHEGMEMLPVQLLIAPKKVVKTGWWIAKVLERRAVVNREKSDWEPDAEEGKIRLFRKLVISKPAGEPAVFRLEEMPEVILMREDVVAAAKKAKLSGLRFEEPAKYNSM
jgi:hypothetical protein